MGLWTFFCGDSFSFIETSTDYQKSATLKTVTEMYKLIALMATPIIWVLSLITLGLILELRQQRKKYLSTGRILIILAGLVLYLFSIPAISGRLLFSLENQNRQPNVDILSNLDLVIILGSGIYPSGVFRERSEPTWGTNVRIFEGIKAFQKSSAEILALCGGGDGDYDVQETEAGVMKILAIELGVREDKIIIEDKSQNTMENATNLKKLLPPQKHRKIGLVTSALHMPRSARVFRQVFPEATIVPIPVGYRYTPSKRFLSKMIPSSLALQTSTEAIHEWIGMIWYKIRYTK
jgi:uncharacterized SAM-binding protein YcdF (DUF218 family)